MVEHTQYDDEGNSRHYEAHAYPVFDQQGEVVQMIEYFLEITERKKALQKFRDEREFSTNIVNGTSSIICRIAADGTTLFLNPAGSRITGYSAEELVGRNWWSVFYPGDEYKQVEQLFKTFEHGDVADYRMIQTSKNGDKKRSPGTP